MGLVRHLLEIVNPCQSANVMKIKAFKIKYTQRTMSDIIRRVIEKSKMVAMSDFVLIARMSDTSNLGIRPREAQPLKRNQPFISNYNYNHHLTYD